MVSAMNRPRAKKFNKFKKKNPNKFKQSKAPPVQPVREPPKNDAEAKVHLVTQDIKFAQALAGNDKKVRDKFLKNLKKWLNTRSNTSFPFTDQDFLRLWKGLFYCMWMSDKPLIQEQLCEDMGSLFYCFDNPAIAVQFYGRFLETISQEWIGIDHWRLDKFMMLVRRVTRHLFAVLHKNEWNVELLKQLRKEITNTVLKEGVLSFGCTMHFLSLFWEEVAKVSDGKISTKSITGLIRPFLAFLTDTRDQRLSKRVVVDIFYALLKQSDLGRQYEEKYEVWKNFGFPSENINDIEMVEEEGSAAEEEDEEEAPEEPKEIPKDGNVLPPEQIALDPRAGNVSVVLAELPFNARKIYELMEKAIYDANTRSVNRKVIKKIMARFEKFIQGEFPLGVQHVTLPAKEAAKLPNIDEKVQQLENLTQEAFEISRLWKTLNKGEKKRFYKSGMTELEYLEHLGKLTDKTNGVTVEEMSDDQEDQAVPTKKRKSHDGDDKKKNKKKAKQSNDADTSVELDNGFEVEEVQEEEEVKSAEDVSPQKEKKSKKAKKDKAPTAPGNGGVFDQESEWDKPLEEGEVEFYVTPTKQRLKHLNGDIEDRAVVKNPFAKQPTPQKQNQLTVPGVTDSPKTPVNKKLNGAGGLGTPNSSGKRVKIALDKNMAQEKSEYFRQLRASPQIPFDSTKKPAKGLLKPHSMPSPINPYYKKKIGLKLDD